MRWHLDEVFVKIKGHTHYIRHSPCLSERRCALDLAFSDRLTYCRKQGFRTPKTSIVFRALEDIGTGNFKMAEGMGFEPTTPFGEHAFQACALNRSATPPAGGGSLTQPAGAGARRDGMKVANHSSKGGAHCVLFAGHLCAKRRLQAFGANPLRNRIIPVVIFLSESVDRAQAPAYNPASAARGQPRRRGFWTL